MCHLELRPAETFMCACLRPREAACFRVWKCANNCQLIVAGIQRFKWNPFAARFHVINTCKSTYTQTLIGVFFVHGNGNTHYACVSYTMMKSVLLRRTPSLNDFIKLKGECTDFKSGCSTSVGLSLNSNQALEFAHRFSERIAGFFAK